MRSLILAALLFGSAAILAQPHELATLCTRDGSGDWRCRPSAEQIRVAPAGADRLYSRTDSDLRSIELGIIPAGAESPATAGTTGIVLTVAQPDNDRWAAPVALSLAGLPGEWRSEIPATALSKPWRITAPAGEYVLTLRAPHHRPWRETIELGAHDVTLGTRALRRNPVIEGIVRMSDGAPLPAAVVRASEALSAMTDALGRFSIEIEEAWPEALEVSYAGLAPRIVAVPRAERSVELPAIAMVRGGTLALEIERNSFRDAIDVEILRSADAKRTAIRSARIAPERASLTLNGLAEGEYTVLLRGEEPLEQLAVPVTITSGEIVRRTVEIEPLAVRIEVVSGTNPVPGARIEAIHLESDARSEFAADADGLRSTRAWQRGEYLFAVRAHDQSAPIGIVEPIDGSDEAQLRFELPDRAIRGRVIDAATRLPIASAAVMIDSTMPDGSASSMRVESDANGAFVIDALQPGSHDLTAITAEYLESEAVHVDLAESDHRRDITLSLRRGSRRAISVVTPNALPVRRAALIHVANGSIQRVVPTNDLGEAELPLPADSASIVYVIPREGSMAVRHLRAGDETKTTIVVPDVVGSLEIRTADSAGRPIPGVRFLTRFDGEIIPPDVQRQIEGFRGYATVTDADGKLRLDGLPNGFFEFWPLRTRGELDDILDSVGDTAPVQVAVKPGHNLAQLTFARK